ncbi:MAG: MmpS family transport accessory protein [Gordonia amarae]
MLTRVARHWLPLVIVVALVLGVYVVDRLHTMFGSADRTTREGSGILNDAPPFHPKVVNYQVYGPPGSTATINYLDLTANPQSVKDEPLPWSLTLTTTSPATSPNLIAQGSAETIGCRITVDGELKDERNATGVTAFTFCQVKSA